MAAGQDSGAGPGDRVAEIRVHLSHPHELFELPQIDLFAEHRNWLTGMEYAITNTKGRWGNRPIRVVVELPRAQITDDLHPAIVRNIGTYCRNRIDYNRNEISATRRDGVGALAVGLCILLVGMAAAQLLRTNVEAEWAQVFVADGLFLVVAWVGLWYPLDSLVYYARPYRLENGALARLIDAEVVLEPYDPRPDAL